MQAPTQAQTQAPSPGQQVVMLALKGATLVPKTIQLSFCLDPSWGKIPMMRGPNGEYVSQWVEWRGRKNGEC